MKSSSKLRLTPSLMRIILGITLVAIVVAAALGFAYTQREMLGFAKEISRLKVDATASNTTIASLERVQSELQTYNDVSQKTQALRANDEFPEFRVIDEITKIAERNNISVADFSYKNGEGTTAENATPPASTPTPTPTSETAPNGTSSGKTISLTVNFKTITNYQNYLQFLYDIEQNVPKFKIKSVGVSSNKQATDVNSEQSQGNSQPSSEFGIDPLTVELYIR